MLKVEHSKLMAVRPSSPNKKINIGVGLRPTHYPEINVSDCSPITWLEVVSENYMDTKGRPWEKLLKFREDFPIATHGVALSLGSAEEPNKEYLKRLKNYVEILEPFIVSDHFCWTGVDGYNTHDLLPLPFTDEVLKLFSYKIDLVQSYLQRPLVIENPSTYFTFVESHYTEWEFLLELTRKTGCQLLLDINNIYVSASNHQYDPYTYIEAIPSSVVAQIHLAGHTNMGNYLFDTHSKPVCDEVWDLFRTFIKKDPGIPVMVEWDEEIPPFNILKEEAIKAYDVCRTLS